MTGIRKIRSAAMVVVTAIAVAGATFIAKPLPKGLLDGRDLSSVRITDRGGGLLRELLSRRDGRSVPLPQSERIPSRVRAAFLAAEDRRFGSHPGVDPLAVARASWQNVRSRRIVSGASTIPQQLARQLVPRERTLRGKAGEAMWALRLSAHLDDERILREYLDRVSLGRDVHGVEAAAELYFGKPAATLSDGQAAMLAGMAASPARFDPFRHPESSHRRMHTVLAAMERGGFLTAERRRVAEEAPLDLVPAERAFGAPHLVQWLDGSMDELGLDGAVLVETTLDPGLQADVEEMIRQQLEGLVDRRVAQAAAIVIDNETGEILAYAGSKDFLDVENGGQNDGVRARRQPGSALKPFAYGLALSKRTWTPSTILSDVEVHLSTPGGDYVPRNYDRRMHGPVRLRAALANSYNVPAVRLAEQLGPASVWETLRAAGFDSLSEDPSYYGVGVVLGNGDVSLRELARAYRGLARGGIVEPITELRRAEDAAGREIPLRPERAADRFLSPDVSMLVTDILSDERARAPAFGLDNALRLSFPVAAKTGTSRAHVDNWTAGYTRERTVAVWVGNFDGMPMEGVSGITGAAPLFGRIMTRAMRGIAPAPLVDRARFAHATVCALSGKRAGPSCPSSVEEVFLHGTAPRETCDIHRLLAFDPATGLAVACGDPRGVVRAVTDVGPAYHSWAQAEGLDAGPWPLDACGTGAVRGIATPREARLVSPRDGDEYLLEAGIPDGAQQIPVRITAPAGTRALELRQAGVVLAHLEAPFSTRVAASPGTHRLELWAPGGTQPLSVSEYRVHGAGTAAPRGTPPFSRDLEGL